MIGALAAGLCAAAAAALGSGPPPTTRLSRTHLPGVPVRTHVADLLSHPRAALIAAGALAVPMWVLAGGAPAVAAAVLTAAVVPEVRLSVTARDARRTDIGWEVALRAAAGAVAAGAVLPAALRRAAHAAAGCGSQRVAATLEVAAATASLGGTATAARDQAPAHPAHLLTAALTVSAELGAPLAPVLQRLADAVADRARAERAAGVALAGARTTVRMLAALPVAGVALAATFGVSAPSFLLGTRPGHVCLLVGAAFEAAGLAWTRRLLAVAAA